MMNLFEYLDQYSIDQINQSLMQCGHFTDLINLMCTCRRLAQLGSSSLMPTFMRLLNTPPVNETREGQRCRVWYDDHDPPRPHRGGDLPAIIFDDGVRLWYRHGMLHRDRDLPAVINATMVGDIRGPEWDFLTLVPHYQHGTQAWYQNNLLHRDSDDQPAVIDADGSRQWYYMGDLHRDSDQPAVITANGSRMWYFRGHLHRDAIDQPSIINADGSCSWYCLGDLHRENDQPARIYADGTCEWWYHGKHHRDKDQPAIIGSDGRREWYRYGYYHRDSPDQPVWIDANGQGWIRDESGFGFIKQTLT